MLWQMQSPMMVSHFLHGFFRTAFFYPRGTPKLVFRSRGTFDQFIGKQWEKHPLHWWSAGIMPPILVASRKNATPTVVVRLSPLQIAKKIIGSLPFDPKTMQPSGGKSINKSSRNP